MIAIGLFLALTALAIATLALFWQNIVEWVKKAVAKIQSVIKNTVKGTRTFITKFAGSMKNKSKYYCTNQVTHEWEEVVYTKEVDPEEVPPEIRAKLLNATEGVDVSTTEELSLQLQQAQAKG